MTKDIVDLYIIQHEANKYKKNEASMPERILK